MIRENNGQEADKKKQAGNKNEKIRIQMKWKRDTGVVMEEAKEKKVRMEG